MTIGQNTLTLHATAVAVSDKALLLIGPSGSGKSALAIQLIAFGADLISDDQCMLLAKDDGLYVKRPKTLPKAIEARGLGLLKAPMTDIGKIALIVDMAQSATARMPEENHTELLGHHIRIIPKSEAVHFPAAILLYLKHGFAT